VSRACGAASGQALVELALVLPLTLLLGCGAVAVVQLARTQMAMQTASDAAALVAARAVDARVACSQAEEELATVVQESQGLLAGQLHNMTLGTCVGQPPLATALPATPGSGSYQVWFGYGGSDDSFCRLGGAPNATGLTDGDVEVMMAFRPDLDWIPVLGNWLSPVLHASDTEKIAPFRSRDPSQDPTGDDC
jgi:hypothetical protein